MIKEVDIRPLCVLRVDGTDGALILLEAEETEIHVAERVFGPAGIEGRGGHIFDKR